MGKDNTAYGVYYTAIDGKKVKSCNLYGYCKAHKGILTYPLAQLHRCKCRTEDGEACMHFIQFDRIDNRYTSALKGEEFRESLGKKGKRKGEREKRKTSNAVPKTAEIPACTSKDYTFGRVEQVGDLPSVSEDSRLETDGLRHNEFKDRCSQCFWRKMFCRVVRTYVCTGRGDS